MSVELIDKLKFRSAVSIEKIPVNLNGSSSISKVISSNDIFFAESVNSHGKIAHYVLVFHIATFFGVEGE